MREGSESKSYRVLEIDAELGSRDLLRLGVAAPDGALCRPSARPGSPRPKRCGPERGRLGSRGNGVTTGGHGKNLARPNASLAVGEALR